MSGIFDALFNVLGRPEGERGPLNPGANQPPGRNKQTTGVTEREVRKTPQTAPSTPRVTTANLVVNSRPVSRTPQPGRGPLPTPTSADRNSEVDMSMSTLADISVETTSTQADIQLGDQPIPYVYHRRSQTAGQTISPSGDMQFRNQRYRQISSPAFTHLPPSAMSLSTISHAENKSKVESDTFLLSEWRQEQLKHMKPAKLVSEANYKTLSSLHGPLSLPYARNPSGVDATVPDNSAYYGNTFGLRSIPKWGETDRVFSTGTNGTRSTSGSSLAMYPPRPKHSIDAETGQQSAMMIRDPYQRIGVTIKTGDDLLSRRVAEPLESARLAALAARSGLADSSSQYTQKQLSRRALGHKSVSTIADRGDESQNVDSLKPLIEAALDQLTREGGRFAAQYDDATIARLLSTARYFGIDPRKVSNSSSEGSRVPSLDTSSSRSSGLSKLPETPQYPPGLGPSSKADVSANWRAKNKRYSSSSHDSPSKSPSLSSSPPAPVMTIDELMAKFSSPESNSKETAIKFKAPSPVDPAMKEEVPVTKPTGSKTTSTKPSSTNKSKTLVEVSMNVSPAVSPKPTSTKKPTVSKGTPGAGKLLKKPHVSSAMPAPPMPTATKTASKLAAIAEQAGDAKAAK